MLYIDYPLEAEANIEDNPFHYQATTPKAPGQPGSFSIYSAYRYIPDVPETPTVVWQYWWYRYSEYEGSFQGIYDPAPSNLDNFNIIVAEDATGYLPFCVASIAPESVIDITFFNDNTMTAKVVGEVYNPNIQQLCTRYIQGVEISIDAEEVMDN